jgi:hypothetical protein
MPQFTLPEQGKSSRNLKNPLRTGRGGLTFERRSSSRIYFKSKLNTSAADHAEAMLPTRKIRKMQIGIDSSCKINIFDGSFNGSNHPQSVETACFQVVCRE